MAKKSRMSILKRQREARKAEKQALKRERRVQRKAEGALEPTREDLAAYLAVEAEDLPDEELEEAERG